MPHSANTDAASILPATSSDIRPTLLETLTLRDARLLLSVLDDKTGNREGVFASWKFDSLWSAYHDPPRETVSEISSGLVNLLAKEVEQDPEYADTPEYAALAALSEGAEPKMGFFTRMILEVSKNHIRLSNETCDANLIQRRVELDLREEINRLRLNKKMYNDTWETHCKYHFNPLEMKAKELDSKLSASESEMQKWKSKAQEWELKFRELESKVRQDASLDPISRETEEED